jgi:hypothetical protein
MDVSLHHDPFRPDSEAGRRPLAQVVADLAADLEAGLSKAKLKAALKAREAVSPT